ncbi:MAG: PstS family phosphate ABC transporter substrate-binding protein [Opitutales bacterium]
MSFLIPAGRLRWAAALVFAALALNLRAASASNANPAAPREALELQQARNAVVRQFAQRKYYDAALLDLSDLPAYAPEQQVTGVIRIWGSDMFGGEAFKTAFENGFRKFHPGVTFEYNLGGPSLAVSGLTVGACEVGVARRVSWELLLAFQRIHNYDPLEITGMTGWAVNPAFVVAVHRTNPLAQLTLRQLDGIYGAARTGGWVGTTWHPEHARGPEGNIRTWGQLGLGGEWSNRPIHVYGYNLRFLYGPRFSDDVLQGSDQWNENLRQYAHQVGPDGKLLNADQQMANDLARDPAGIAYWSYGRAASPDIKLIALAGAAGGPAVAATLATVRDHRYPLYDRMYFYLDRQPGHALDPRLREFMRYVLSRDAQALVARDTTMLPLTAEMVRVERNKLE